jgi:hypothetical protein
LLPLEWVGLLVWWGQPSASLVLHKLLMLLRQRQMPTLLEACGGSFDAYFFQS